MPGIATSILAMGSGGIVGLVLGLVGGGGSILAVPLLVYVVGVKSPHVAIGTSAIAVSMSALGNLFAHSRAGNVKWRCAFVFAAAGVIGALAGCKGSGWSEAPRTLRGCHDPCRRRDAAKAPVRRKSRCSFDR